MTPWLLIAAVTLGVAPGPSRGASEAARCACDEMGREAGAVMLATGIALGVTSMVAFSTGFEAERQLRAREVQGTAAADALTERTVAAFVAWPAALLSVGGVAAGAYFIGGAE